MATVNYLEHPRITDTIEFELLTPGIDGCLSTDPYKVDNIKIFFVEKNFASGNLKEIDVSILDSELDETASDAEQEYCDNPTDENLASATQARAISDAAETTNTLYYGVAIPVAIFGTENFPAWISTDADNALIEHVTEDEDGNPIYGNFKLTWTPQGGTKEGDYFVCWTWTPLPAGDTLSKNVYFSIDSDTNATASIPSHATPDGKYELLLERYTPSIYKTSLCDNDLTATTIDTLNQVIAGGFTQLEDLANQIIDLYNANIVHESLLVLLSNMLGRKLRSEDPTLWRRQTANAIPLYKKKGTYNALEQALDEAGMTLSKITKMWQVISSYTFQEAFIVDGSDEFLLSLTAVLPVDDNYVLYLRPFGDTEYVLIPIDYVEFLTEDGVTTMTWVGDEKSSNPMSLFDGDELLIKYKIKEIPNATQQSIEDFIVTLPLADQRDSQEQDYPLKNWNVRLIEEDDPMFDIVIPSKHPFQDPVVFGWIRTEFPYSENIYNMETYNGSLRESNDPCDIDKTFLDPCYACLSSSVIMDIGIEEISDLRVKEARDVISEFSPFHMNLFQLNVTGDVEEVVPPPVEELQILVTMSIEEFVLAGNANGFFTRVRDEGDTTNAITRDALATGTTVASGLTGTGYNVKVVLYDFTVNFEDFGINLSNHVFEVLSPSVNAGTYTITDVNKNTLTVTGVTEPLNTSSFNYNILNKIYTTTGAGIIQDDLFIFSDDNIDFVSLGTLSIRDGINWKIYVPAYSPSPFLIEDILSDGTLVLQNNGALPVSNDTAISYTLLTDTDVEVTSSLTGELSVTRRGLMDVNDTNLASPVGDVQTILKFGDLVEISGTQYPINHFVDDQTFYIYDYSLGNAAGLSVPIYRSLVSMGTGYFDYQGIKLQTAGDHETEFNILNGDNAPVDENYITESDSFKENYLVVIDGTDYYKISEWDGDTITLDGPKKDWTTLTAGGTSVGYSLVQFTKGEITVDVNTSLLDPDVHKFSFIDRRGNDMVEALLPNETTSFIALANAPGARVEEAITQEENVSFIIKYKDGSTEEGEL